MGRGPAAAQISSGTAVMSGFRSWQLTARELMPGPHCVLQSEKSPATQTAEQVLGAGAGA